MLLTIIISPKKTTDWSFLQKIKPNQWVKHRSFAHQVPLKRYVFTHCSIRTAREPSGCCIGSHKDCGDEGSSDSEGTADSEDTGSLVRTYAL